jgi:hypothetical protein
MLKYTLSLHMNRADVLKAAQGDAISLGIASCQQEFTEREVL